MHWSTRYHDGHLVGVLVLTPRSLRRRGASAVASSPFSQNEHPGHGVTDVLCLHTFTGASTNGAWMGSRGVEVKTICRSAIVNLMGSSGV